MLTSLLPQCAVSTPTHVTCSGSRDVTDTVQLLKAAHAIILASCKPGFRPGFRPGLQPGFRQVRVGLRHAFDCFCRKPGREPQQVRRFVRVLDKLNVEKNPFKQVCSWLSTCLRPGLHFAAG